MSLDSLKGFLYQKVPSDFMQECMSHQSRNFVPYIKERDYLGRLYETQNKQQTDIDTQLKKLKKKKVLLHGN